MKELFLGPILVSEKLNVINQQGVDRPIEALKVIDGVQLKRLYHISDKSLRVQVDDLRIGVFATHGVTDSVHQVCLAEPNPTIQK